jgi:RecB family exonuclease
MSTFKVVSATMIDTVRTCPLKARFKYIDRLPETARSGALVLGIAVDVAAKHVIHGLRAGDLKIGAIDAEAVLSRAWDEELARNREVGIVWPERGSEEKGRATALALLKAFSELPDLAERVSRIQDVDVRFEIPLPDPETGRALPGVFVQGILDFVDRTPDGRFRACDLKTAGSRQGYDPDDLAFHLQGALYALAVRSRFGDLASDEFSVWLGLKLKVPIWEDRVVTLGPTAQKRALLTALHAKRVLDLGIAYPVRGWQCPSCRYAGPCASWQDSPASALRRDPFAA